MPCALSSRLALNCDRRSDPDIFTAARLMPVPVTALWSRKGWSELSSLQQHFGSGVCSQLPVEQTNRTLRRERLQAFS